MRKKKEKIYGIYAWEVISGNPNKIGGKYVGQAVDIFERKTYKGWTRYKEES